MFSKPELSVKRINLKPKHIIGEYLLKIQTDKVVIHLSVYSNPVGVTDVSKEQLVLPTA